MADNLPPSVLEASTDRALDGAPRDVLLWLWGQLERHDFRPMKVSAIVAGCAFRRDTVSAALDVLVQRGYLAEGRRSPRGVRTFRLLETRLRKTG